MSTLGRWAAFLVCVVMLGALAMFAAQHPGWVLLGGLFICAVFWHKGARYEEVDRISRKTDRIVRTRARGRAPDGRPWN